MKKVNTYYHKMKYQVKTWKHVFTSIIVFTFAVVIFLAIMFVFSYKKLEKAIQLERLDYVDEISKQIITSHQFLKDEYSSAVQNYAGMLEAHRCDNLEDVCQHFSGIDKADILLVSEDYEIIDLNGRSAFVTDKIVFESFTSDEKTGQSFISINNEIDYWVFDAHIDNVEIDGVIYIRLAMIISADEFRDSLAVSLFDNQGASYIIKNNGRIEIKPKETTEFGGFNLYTSMLQKGASNKAIATLEERISAGETGNQVLEIQRKEWLISYSNIDKELSIVVAVPLSVTAIKTYSGLKNAIFFAALTILQIGVIAILFILLFFHRDRARKNEALAAEAKNNFFSKMSHDIRTPLNTIIGLQTLAQDEDNIYVVKEQLNKSSFAAQYLLDIVNDVLDIGQIENEKLIIKKRQFDMQELVNDVNGFIRSMIAKTSKKFSVEVEKPFVNDYMGDAIRIKQIIINLLGNSVKFTKENSEISLKLSYEILDDELDRLKIIVSDTGIGMSEAFLEHMYKPFEQEESSYTAQFAGSGLGLAIVHNLIMLMNGTIDVNSKLNVGTTFTILLPLERSNKTKKDEELTKKALTCFKGMRVLLAEDNEINQQIVRTLLMKRFSIISEVASDGEKAFDMFVKSGKGYYKMILMDIKMPKMDGLEATRNIRSSKHPDALTIPIIALSANAYSEDMDKSMKAGMDEHLAKPLDIVLLLDILNKYLCKGESEDE